MGNEDDGNCLVYKSSRRQGNLHDEMTISRMRIWCKFILYICKTQGNQIEHGLYKLQKFSDRYPYDGTDIVTVVKP
jgi:hypothetical protein